MKRMLITVVLMTTLAAGIILPTHAASFSNLEQNGYNTLVFADDFSSDVAMSTFWNYQSATGSVAPEKVYDPFPDGVTVRSKVAKLSNEANAENDHYMRMNYAKIDPAYSELNNPLENFMNQHSLIKYSFDILWPENIAGDVHFVHYDCLDQMGLGTRNVMKLMEYTTNGTISFLNDSSTTISYSPQTWYSFTFYLDFVNNTYTAYQGDTLILKNIKLHPSTDLITALSFGVTISKSTSPVTLYLDNVSYSAASNYTSAISITKVIKSADFSASSQLYEFDRKYISGDPVQYSVVNGAAKMNTQTTNGTYTDMYLRAPYTLINPNYTTELLTGEQYTQAQKAIFDVKLMPDVYLNIKVNAVLHHTVTERKEIPLVQFFGSEKYMHLLNGRDFPFTPNQWYSFRFYVDFANKTYSACLNGSIVAENVSLAYTGVSNYNYALSFTAYLGKQTVAGNLYVDDYNYSLVSYTQTADLRAVRQGEELYSVFRLVPPTEAMTLVGVIYGDTGSLIKINTVSSTAEDGGKLLALPFDYAAGQAPYIMQWNSLTDMKPLAEKVLLTGVK